MPAISKLPLELGAVSLRLHDGTLVHEGAPHFTQAVTESTTAPNAGTRSETTLRRGVYGLKLTVQKCLPTPADAQHGESNIEDPLPRDSALGESRVVLWADAVAEEHEHWWHAGAHGLAGNATVCVELQLPEFERGMALFLPTPFWTVPQFVSSPEQVPDKTQFLLWQNSDGSYAALAPLSGGDLTSYLCARDTKLYLEASTFEDGALHARGPLFVSGRGKDPYKLIENLFADAVRVLGHTAQLRRSKPFPEALQYFGWCTWDAFYRELSPEGITQQLQHWQSHGLQPGFVLLDDGWYRIKDKRLLDATADPRIFPNELGTFFQTLRTQFSLRYVGVWHSMTGYWYGVHEQHRMDASFQRHLEAFPTGALNPGLSRTAAFGFFNAWHSYLEREGADFVKVDGQGMLARISQNRLPLARAAANVQGALQDSVAAHFGGNMINCMSMSHDLLWQSSRSNVTRSSEDYMYSGKERPLATHAVENAYNSLYLSQLSWCDWDMFRTDQSTSQAHAALRVLSGGPLYVSDRVEVTRFEVLHPLMLASGKLLRCDEVGIPIADCLLRDPRQEPVLLGLKNRSGSTGVLGLFHLNAEQGELTQVITPDRLGLPPAKRYVLWCSTRGSGQKLRPEGCLVSLRYEQAAIYLLCPIDHGFAAIGLEDKWIAPATVKTLHIGPNGVQLELRQGGRFVCFTERRPARIVLDGQTLDASRYEYSDQFLEVDASSSNRPQLRFDF